MSLRNRNVLVTGAEGFIGSHLVESLVREGAKVTVIIKNNFKHDLGFIDTFEKEVKSSLKIFFGDINDAEFVRSATTGQEIVFHLAAEISIPYSYLNTRTFANTNIMGTLNMLIASKESTVKRFIFMSSSEVYGTPKTVPITEEHALQGQSPYSATKIGAEKLVESFYTSYSLPVSIVRAFNTYGPRQSARAIIPTIITQALFADEIKVGNLAPTRDFNYVSDTVQGLLHVAASEKIVGEAVNIGSGKEISMGDLLNKIVTLTQSKARVIRDNQRIRPEKSEVMRLCADNTKMREATGWGPKVSFEEGLQKTIAWIQNNKNDYNAGEYRI